MSLKAKATLLASIGMTTLIVWGVHFQQKQEREMMFQGVMRDDERRRKNMRQREDDLRESQRKREVYESVQRVSTSPTPPAPRGNAT